MVMAGPACDRPFALHQPDGTIVTARRGGDEKFNWVQVDGRLVEKGADGFWRYLQRAYYDQASRNTFRFTPAPESYGTVDNGVVRVRLKHAHPDPGDKVGEANKQIACDAIVAADPYVNFAAFDADDSGALTSSELHIAVIVAGYEGGSGDDSPSIWRHKGWLWGDTPAPTLDGVIVADYDHDGGYIEVGELMGTAATSIGTICHELGHDLGLPDLYDRDGSSEGVGIHCLMGCGSWGAAEGEQAGVTPVILSAWCRTRLGWLTPAVATSGGTYTLVQASDPADSNVLKIPTKDPNQYFLLENRQPTGFDAGLYEAFSATSSVMGGGIAIWHINESVQNDDPFDANDDETHKKVALEEANEGEVGESELDHNLNSGSRQQYYYDGHVTRFDDTTSPNAHLCDGTLTGVAVSDVSASGERMSVAFAQKDLLVSATPADGMTCTGRPGRPFSPGSIDCTLTCTGQQAVSWTASNTQPWLTLSKTSGTLAPGAPDTVTVSINTAANDLALGDYRDTVTVTDAAGGHSTYPVTLVITKSAGGGGCGQGVGPANLIGLYAVCWVGLASAKWGRRRNS